MSIPTLTSSSWGTGTSISKTLTINGDESSIINVQYSVYSHEVLLLTREAHFNYTDKNVVPRTIYENKPAIATLTEYELLLESSDLSKSTLFDSLFVIHIVDSDDSLSQQLGVAYLSRPQADTTKLLEMIHELLSFRHTSDEYIAEIIKNKFSDETHLPELPSAIAIIETSSSEPLSSSSIESPPETTLAFCSDSLDNDHNGLIDCDEPLCLNFSVCSESGTDFCQDQLDNDNDSFIDCLDDECALESHCLNESSALSSAVSSSLSSSTISSSSALVSSSSLSSSLYSSSSLFSSSARSSSVSSSLVVSSSSSLYSSSIEIPTNVENTDALCSDRRDNDSDGLIDCEDVDCALTYVCSEKDYRNCSDGLDNNYNGYIDCDDPECTPLDICKWFPSDANALDYYHCFENGTDLEAVPCIQEFDNSTTSNFNTYTKNLQGDVALTLLSDNNSDLASKCQLCMENDPLKITNAELIYRLGTRSSTTKVDVSLATLTPSTNGNSYIVFDFYTNNTFQSDYSLIEIWESDPKAFVLDILRLWNTDSSYVVEYEHPHWAAGVMSFPTNEELVDWTLRSAYCNHALCLTD